MKAKTKISDMIDDEKKEELEMVTRKIRTLEREKNVRRMRVNLEQGLPLWSRVIS